MKLWKIPSERSRWWCLHDNDKGRNLKVLMDPSHRRVPSMASRHLLGWSFGELTMAVVPGRGAFLEHPVLTQR